MTLRTYVGALRKRWWLIVGLAVLLGAVGFAYARSQTPMYRSSATSYVTLSSAGSVSELVQGSTYTQNLIQSFALLATTPAVLDPVIDDLGLDVSPTALARSVTVDVPLNSFLIRITAVSSEPAEAQAIANAVSDELSQAVQRLSPTTAEGGATVRLESVAPATVPMYPFSPNTRQEAVTWAAGGAALGALLALLLTLLDTKVRTEVEVAEVTRLPVLGLIPKDKRLARRPRLEPVASEAVRRLRTNLTFLDAGRHLNSIVVTSPSASEGKTTVAVSLATALAEVHDRVLLIDADLRRPTAAVRTGVLPDAGLTDILIGRAELEEVVQEWQDSGVYVLAAGVVPPNPSQLIEGAAMKSLLELASREFDFVVVDSPPLLPVVDAALITRRVGGAIVVANAQKTTRSSLAKAIGNLDAIDSEALGVVLVGTAAPTAYYGTQ